MTADETITPLQRGAIAQLSRLQSARNWASYAVMDDDTATAGLDDFDTVMSPRIVRASESANSDQSLHEVLSVRSNHSTAFFCFNEESSSLSRYVRSFYYSAVSLKVAEGDGNMPFADGPAVHELSEYLQIEIISASDLAVADLIGTSDPYCVIYWQGEKLFQTKVMFRNLNPQWNETFSIPLSPEDMSSCSMSVHLFDSDGSSALVNDDFLGQVTLNQTDMPWNKRRNEEVSECLYASCNAIAIFLTERQHFNMELHPRPSNASLHSDHDIEVKGRLKFRLSKVRKPFNFWTAPVRVGQPCTEHVSARSVKKTRHLLEVTVKDVESVRVISIREHTIANPPAFKIINRLPDLRIRFRQVNTDPTQHSRCTLSPAEYMYYAWDNCTQHKSLAVCAVDEEGTESPLCVYNLEAVGIDLTPLDVSGLRNEREEVSVKVVVEGQTRCLVLSNPPERGSRMSFRKIKATGTSRINELLTVCYRSELLFFFTGLTISFIDEVRF
jgi:hypothetical protein